jgi:hypothetical protein
MEDEGGGELVTSTLLVPSINALRLAAREEIGRGEFSVIR